MTLGVIGYGNMGQAIVRGVSRKKLFQEIVVFDVIADKIRRLPGGTREGSLDDVLKADLVLLAIKPQDVAGFLEKEKEKLAHRHLPLISIVAGLPVAFYRQWLTCPLARVIPNTPAQVGESASVVYFDGDFSEEHKEKIKQIFLSLGLVEVVAKEELLHAVTGLSGSGPAYVFLFLSALADGGVMEGLPRDIAKRLAIQTVLGSAKLALQALSEDKSFEDLKDMVMSPGGTTARGVYALENAGFRAAVMQAVSDATKRSRELGGK
ncbi:pyrroline-5-carboxylate reductase [Thermospira aquatica]|uniref:Pyrroline-5-carboxylate reductase n=1 Tax=Thermospira aquatica TaxID=2828656 RepID=A0AAX3BA45_9SPIR|nr:pyrroline-5-carboxylate reductase [Thermospira aquatica]URA09115.1 pyrroline-5-carboxylate reductase [Thermospira aquatica]